MRGGTVPRSDREHALPDDRALAWCEYGRPDGSPLLYFHGEDDRSISIAHSQWLAARIPGAALTTWPRTGHLHTGERSGEVFTRLAGNGDPLP